MSLRLAIYLVAGIVWFAMPRAHAADDCGAAHGAQTAYSINVKTFGAVGNGSTDDTAAIQRAAQCASRLIDTPQVQSAELYFPGGVYNVSNRVVITGTDAAPHAGSLVIRGDGMMASRIVATSKSGLFAITLANITTQVQLTQLGLFSELPGGGTAFAVTMPAKGILQRRAVEILHVTIGGIDIHKDYFDTGIYLYATDRPLINDVLMTGPYGPGSDGRGLGICYDLRGTYSPTITDSACWGAQKGVEITGLNVGRLEGVFISRSKFVNVDYGIIVNNSDRMPEGMISENHINAHIAGLILQGKKFVTVRDNLFYYQTGKDGAPYNDIILNNTEKILITGNTFHFPGEQNRTAINIENSRDDTISENMFNQPGTGIVIGRGVLNTRILRNRFFVQDLIRKVPLNSRPIVDNGVGTEVESLRAEAGAEGAPPAKR